MKKSYKTLAAIGLCSVVLLFNLGAQTSDENLKYKSGGFGSFFIGTSYYRTKNISDYLRRPDVLGSDYSPSNISYIIGGEGGMIRSRLFIGGGGFNVITPVSSTELGYANFSMSGAYLKLGYKLYEDRKMFMFFYTSIGLSGYALEIKNSSDTKNINFNHKAPIYPSEKRTYSEEGLLFDIGTSLKTISLSKESESGDKIEGLVLGIDLGILAYLPLNEWQNSRNIVVGPPNLIQMLSPYIRLTIGGGGFGLHK
jgi:hypothetical protein